MAARFKYLRAVPRSYAQQGEIYFTCINYKRQPEAVKAKIRRLCTQAGGEYAAALLEYLTTDSSWQGICDKYYISDRTLQRCRERFYNLW